MTDKLTITDLHVEMCEGPISVDGWYGESAAVSIHEPRALFKGSDGIVRVGLFATEEDAPDEDFPSAGEASINVSLTKEQARAWGERLIEASDVETKPSLGGQGFVERSEE